MGVIIPPESDLGKELQRWDTPKREGGEAPNEKLDYPAMVYMAFRYSNGKVMCGHPGASTGDDPEANAFNNKCQFTVANRDEHEKMRRAGWSDSPDDAVALFEKNARGEADAAAEEQYRVNRMSGKAQEEFSRAQDDAEFHDADPAAPPKPAPATHVVSESELRERIEKELREKIAAEMAEAGGKKKPAAKKKATTKKKSGAAPAS